MKVLTMIIWTFLSWTCSRDGGSGSHVISPPTHLDLLTLSRGYQRIPKDTKGYQRIPEDTSTIHAMDGPAFLAFPLLSILTLLHWRGGLGPRKDNRGHQKITRAYKLSRTFWEWGVHLSWPFSSYPSSPPPQRSRLLSSIRAPPLLRLPRYSRSQT